MKTIFRRITAAVTAITVALTVCFVFDAPVNTASAAASGDCGADGSNVTWQLDDAGVLTISGTGAMKDYETDSVSGETRPWYDYTDDITKIVVEDGVTHVGNCSFSNLGFSEPVQVILPDSVISIGSFAFSLSVLTSFPIPSKLQTVGDGAFFATETANNAPVVFPQTVQSIGELGFLVNPADTVEISYYDGVSLTKCDPIDYTIIKNESEFINEYAQKPDFQMKYMYFSLNIMEGIQFDVKDDTFTAITKLGRGTVTVLTPEPDHIHKVCVNAENCADCAHSDITWTAWTSDNSLPSASGNYYLTKDVTVTDVTNIAQGDEVSLCLNGHTVTMDGSAVGKGFYNVEGTLNLSDCQTDGKLTGVSYDETTKPENYAPVYLGDYGKFNMYSGAITGNSASSSGGVYVNRYSVFNMFGGAISNNTYKNSYGGGGGVYIYTGTFTMEGGTISGNTASKGGGVYNYHGTFIMKGGKILQNNATDNGGGVYNYNNNFTISGGTISDNTSQNCGGGVYNNKNFTISGGTISDNTSQNGGGGVYSKGTFEMFDGDISNNEDVTDYGGGVLFFGTFKMHGGTITDNTAASAGGVYVGSSNSTFTMEGGTISRNTANFNNGGGIYNSGTFTMTGGTISQNTANFGNGGGIYNNGTFTIDGTVNITSNTSGGNVYLPSGKTITVGSGFNTSSTIGVTSNEGPTCKVPAVITGSTDTDVSGSFSSDNAAYKITYEEGVIKLTVDHSYSTTYSSDEDYHWFECTACDETGEKTAHTWADNGKTDPTVTAEGSKSSKCDVCGYEKTETIPALSDTTVWTKDGFVTDPKLDSDGTYKYTSDKYGDVTVTVPKLSDSIWTKEEFDPKPTLESTGTCKYTSTEYGDVTVTVPALSDPVWTKVDDECVAPTENTAGKDVYSSVYGKVGVTIPELGHTHTLTKVEGKLATETETGTVEHWHCSGCGKNFSDENGNNEITDITIPKLEHTHTLTKVEGKPATETETGTVEHWHCSGCGKNFSDENGKNEITDITIPELSHTHTLTKVEGKPATETETGTLEHWHCSGCGKNFSDENGKNEITDITIPELGHTHTLTKVEGKPATETETGTVEHWHCSGCGKNFSDKNGKNEITDITIPELGHTHTLTKVEGKPATETETGTVEHWHCSGCGKLFADENGSTEIDISDTVIPAKGSGGSGRPSTSEDTSNPDDTSKPEGSSDPDVIGNKSKEVHESEDVPKAKITTPLNDLISAVIPKEELAQIKDSDNVKIVLNIEDAGETVTDIDKQAVQEALEQLNDFELAQYLDITLFKIINNSESKITSTSKPITVTFEIPEALRGSGGEYAVIRVHDNETTVLNDLDDDENTVTIKTDKFSIYVLAYTDTSSGDTSTDESSSVSSDNETTSPSDESNALSTPGNDGLTENTKNPATGIAVSLIPLTMAINVLTVTVKRKKK